MKSNYSALFIGLAMSATPLHAATLTGQWNFEDGGNLTAAATGAAMSLSGTDAAVAGSGTPSDAGATQVGLGSYYTMTHGIAPNGGGSFVNQYSILFDVNYPASSAGSWRTLMQTNPANDNDGEYFLHPTDESWGVGDLTYTDNATTGEFFSSADTWYRAVLTFDLGNAVNLYIDGNLTGVHNTGSIDDRFSLNPTLLILADNDGDDATMNLSNLAIWDGVLTPGEISDLGGAGRPIPEPSAIALLALAGAFGLRRRR